ncbi:hypothetical protein [Intestinimonas sp. HCP28S3_D6]|uniref:hypothetical protein n=1 Tax=Intestinimonas sp. HCP28S3_D6 TaxID=3438942 RepID=UPI003F8BFC5F
MFNKKTDYALNKMDSTAIIYTDAEGTIVRLTRDNFSSLDEFLKWKAWSDANYHITEKSNHLYLDHTLSMTGLSESVAVVPSPELIEETRQATRCHQRLCAELVMKLRVCLTETQFRRLWMYYADGMSEKQIAKLEGVGQQRISKSIVTARKKAKKFLSFQSKNRG